MRYVIALLLMTAPAMAHSWYSTRHDPVFNNSCCGGSDCNRLDARFISFDGGRYHVVLPFEQARLINPYASAGFDEFIDADRVQPSEDGQYHICLMTYYQGNRKGYWCFFAPPSS